MRDISFWVPLAIVLLVCSSLVLGGAYGEQTRNEINESTDASGPSKSSDLIKVNQVGYLTAERKLAIVPYVRATSFRVVDQDQGKTVFEGRLTEKLTWPLAGDDIFRRADFSDLTAPGRYRIEVDGVAPSPVFVIGDDVYQAVHQAALKAYYFNRASSALEEEYAGAYARPLGHPDTHVVIHKSAATAQRPEGSVFEAPRGWYDAGDFGKYTVNSGISTYTLLAAYEHFPHLYADLKVGIPESGSAVPDILNEIMWNLDWLQAMQDPNDGGVYHKLTTLGFSGEIMPHQGTETRYFIGRGTAAALNFAAVMATASRVYQDFDDAFPGKALEYREAAIRAWEWAQANPQTPYRQAEDVGTGEYGDDSFADEFSWAAAELYLLTRDSSYLEAFKSHTQDLRPTPPYWGGVAALGYISLANQGQPHLPQALYEDVTSALVGVADELLQVYQENAYRVAMRQDDCVWGSNAVALNNAWLLLEAHKITGRSEYAEAARGSVHYVLGRNPTDYSFVSGFGTKPPMALHHRASQADGIAQPIPGFVAGGPHAGQQDGAQYPSNAPAKSYLDHWDSYSTNEIAINWNAPLVYVLGWVNQLDR